MELDRVVRNGPVDKSGAALSWQPVRVHSVHVPKPPQPSCLDFVTYCFCLLESVGNRTLVGERPLFWKCQGIVEMSVKTVHIAYFKSATTLVFIRLFRLDSAILIECFCLLIHLFNVLRLVYR